MLTLAPTLPAIILSLIGTLTRFALGSFRRVAQDRRTQRTLLRLPQPSAMRSVLTTAGVAIASIAFVAVIAFATYSIIEG